MNFKPVFLSVRSQSEKPISCMILIIWHWKKQNYGDGKKISGWQVFGELRGEEQWRREVEGLF